MSRYALAFMFVAAVCWIGALTLEQNAVALGTMLQVLGSISAVAFLLAMVKGRRIKFDPYLH
ncbi:hypothetical protein AHFPHNDE_02528 [Pseudomonas sp. MM227]|uniref:Uncharacterized protein n=1 Tax=Pseudomonas baltica TaxID=2762576 RepID=A0A7X1G1P2_9PSED|nr:MULTISPECIES: PA3371 family protein [Pseudomonas]MBC2676797.1 hypothetical protein [Pseudomonas baltica]MBD8625077.1 hypothetical protein [Pseudomonas sp. CFBP 13727]MBD8730432.1 hypothetical protein [Pseudomonas sp. CFBP 13710]MBD8827517.1 hypothetical protein [Pseudomonas sp. CFBP 13602]CAI3788848.1 hypothetical protein AHFPHNDE_02528 [Pseudomonas sp. MM227]